MINEEVNIFKELSTYAHPEDERNPREDYITHCFVFLLKWLLLDEKNNSVARRVLRYLCTGDGQQNIFGADEKVSVEAHPRISGFDKRPDITVKSEDKYIIVEVKWNSRVDNSAEKRLRNYKKYLGRPAIKSQFTHRHLVLLTKYGDQTLVTDYMTKWQYISRILDASELDTSEVIGSQSSYLIKAFTEFLKEEGMIPVTRMTNKPDVKSMGQWYNFLLDCTQTKFVGMRSEGFTDEDSFGVNILEPGKMKRYLYWVGFYYSEGAGRLWFEFHPHKRKKINENPLKKLPNYGPPDDDKDRTYIAGYDLSPEFFTNTLQQQQNEIGSFLEQCKVAINASQRRAPRKSKIKKRR